MIVAAFLRAGIVTKKMLDTPKRQFLVIGALEAAAQILGFIGAAQLPGGVAAMQYLDTTHMLVSCAACCLLAFLQACLKV